MTEKLKSWYASHTITTHSLMAAVATLTLLYVNVPAFHSLVNDTYAAAPAWVHQVGAAALGIYGYYTLANKAS